MPDTSRTAPSQGAIRPLVLSLCDRTGVMVEPWREAGDDCWIVDTQHPAGRHRDGNVMRIGCDVRQFNAAAMLAAPSIVFAFPPCTNLSVSGARWFQDKGLESLHESLGLVVACKRICEESGAPWMLENPVGILSSYWRKPDYTFQPWQYGDTYTKKTCLWTGGGFVMPPAWIAVKPADVKASIHLMPPSADRGDKRSVTPEGFARAVFAANHGRVEVGMAGDAVARCLTSQVELTIRDEKRSIFTSPRAQETTP